MRRPLFLKIFLGVWLSYIAVTYIVWVTDSILQQSPSRTAERTAHVALTGATSAIRLGGEKALRELLASWPEIERDHFVYQRIDAGPVPAPDLIHNRFVATAIDRQGHRYAFSYLVSRFDGFAPPPLAFDMGPRVLLGSLIGISVFSAALTFYLIAPISRIRAVFRQVAAGDLKVRLGSAWLRRRDEIADLAADFNKMAARLEELVSSRDRLLADMSHELRSPLTRLQLAIALARQSPEKAVQSLDRVGREADRLEEMVGEILALSKLESGAKTAGEYFFVSEIVRIVVDDARFEAQEKRVAINIKVDAESARQEALMIGSGKLISRAIENVVRNALRFSREGDAVTLDLDSNAAGTSILIRDQGPGVEAEELSSLFEPFVQVGTNHGQGYGLGLAIAKRAVIAHGGTISAVNNAEGGLTVTIWLPAAPDVPESGKAEACV